MATGPEHYREAERLLKLVADAWQADVIPSPITVAEAQVHATLALAAASALASTGAGEADLGEWSALICEPDDPYEGMTNADVMSYNRAAERTQNTADQERRATEGEAF